MSVVPDAIRSEGAIDEDSGARLHYRRWSLRDARAALLVVHGMGEHAGRYREFAEAMLARELSVYAYDQRGHGKSAGRRGHVDDFDLLLEDLDRVRREVRSVLPPETPLFLLGHSMGGLVALRYVQERGTAFEGAVLVAPWLASADPPPAWVRLLARILDRILPRIHLPRGTRPELLTRDSAKVRAWEEDPLVHRVITPRFYREARRAQERTLGREDWIRIPVLFLLPGADGIADTAVALAFARGVSREDVEIRVFPDDYHELLNELDRESAFDMVARWVRARAGAGETRPRNRP